MKLILPAFLIAFPLLAANSALSQDCGTTTSGGGIGPGVYAGAGATCGLARKDLNEDMMGPAPDCEGCPQGQVGCHGSNVPDDPNGNITIGNCSLDPVTGLGTVAGTVTQRSY